MWNFKNEKEAIDKNETKIGEDGKIDIIKTWERWKF